jgi:hypothetical protein
MEDVHQGFYDEAIVLHTEDDYLDIVLHMDHRYGAEEERHHEYHMGHRSNGDGVVGSPHEGQHAEESDSPYHNTRVVEEFVYGSLRGEDCIHRGASGRIRNHLVAPDIHHGDDTGLGIENGDGPGKCARLAAK